MSSIESTPIDCPTGYVVTVVHLFQRDAGRDYDVFHRGDVLKGGVRIGIKRLEEDAATPGRQSGEHEGAGILHGEQSGLDRDASREQ